MFFITEVLIGSGSAKGSSTMGLVNPGASIIISSITSLLTSIAILITNEDFSELKLLNTKLRVWIDVITLLYEKILKQARIVKKIDVKDAPELKKIYSEYIDKRKEIMQNSSFKVEDVLGDVISKDNFSQEQISKLNNFLAKILQVQI